MAEVPLVSPFVLEYSYKRSLGPVLSEFMTGLRDGKLLGATLTDGRVMMPPLEYDPMTGDDVGELVEVGPEGTLNNWVPIDEPGPKHPFDKPFAYGLIRLDGTDTDFLHVLDVDPSALKVGLRVKARWRDERVGHISDVECFVEVAE